MAEELAKIDTTVQVKEPNIAAGKRMSFADVMGVQEPFLKKRGEIREEIKATEGEILSGQQRQKEIAAEGKVEVERKAAQDITGAQERLQQKMQAKPLPAFVPTQDNFRDIAGLFSLIGVVGMVAGKSSGLAAMNAMNGMVEGYRAGRSDLYRREREIFDKNFKTMLQKHGEFRKEMDDSVKLAQTNRQAGLQAAELAAVKAGSPIVLAQVKAGNLMGAMQTVDDALKAANTAVTLQNTNINAEVAARERAAQAAQALAQRAQEAERARQQRNTQLVQTPGGLRTINVGNVPPATKEEMEKATPFRGGGQQARAGQNALIFASRVYGNIENAAQDLQNIMTLPGVAQAPALAGLIGTDPGSALRSMGTMVARTITSAEQKAFEQITNSLDAALARLEAQGLASGATKSSIQSFNALKPRAGDKAINMALYIARVKQEIETGIRVHDKMPGTIDEQRTATKEILNNLDKVVPYNVTDVLSVLGRGRETIDDKMQKLLQVPSVARGYDATVTGQPQPAAAPAAAPAGAGPYDDAEKERRYQEWKARQPK